MAQTAPLCCVLVATPTPAFGDMIRHSLKETGKYQVRVVYTAQEAQIVIGTSPCQIAILDNDLSDSRLSELALALHTTCPEIKLVLIPPENDPQHLTLEDIPSAATLLKPFYLPELIDLMDQLSAQEQPELPDQSSLLPWINQPILDQLLTTTSASAGAVARRKGGLVIGGFLPAGAEYSFTALINRFWQREERTDLVRFARLETAQGSFDCLVYLTALHIEDDTAAGLVFPVQTPLSKVRVQTAPLIVALHELAAQSPAQVEQKPSEEAVRTEPLESALQPMSEWVDPADDQSDFDTEFPSFNLAELLGAIPSPDPNGKSISLETAPDDWQPEADYQSPETPPAEPPAALPQDSIQAETALVQPASDQIDPSGEETLVQVDKAEEITPSPLPPVPANQDAPYSTSDSQDTFSAAPLPAPPADAVTAAQPGETAPPAPPAISPSTAIDALAIAANDFLEESGADAAGEQGSVLTSLTSLDQLESATAGLSQLNYTCVLIPRLPQHYLTRELSEKVGRWVQQLCLAFGWRLEGIALRPDYLQWTVQVSPTISPGAIVKIVRQRTSEFIFEQFETLRKQNPSGDFWAAGYLIVSGSQPPSAGLLRDYIHQTRRRQGAVVDPSEAPPRLNS